MLGKSERINYTTMYWSITPEYFVCLGFFAQGGGTTNSVSRLGDQNQSQGARSLIWVFLHCCSLVALEGSIEHLWKSWRVRNERTNERTNKWIDEGTNEQGNLFCVLKDSELRHQGINNCVIKESDLRQIKDSDLRGRTRVWIARSIHPARHASARN